MKEIWSNFFTAIKQNKSFTFRLGIFFLLINIPFGYILGTVFAFIAGVLFSKAIGGIVWVVCYATSWAMLGLGILLAGKGGYQIFKKLVQDIKAQLFSKKNNGLKNSKTQESNSK
jgi:uncharacterized integral membrane protein